MQTGEVIIWAAFGGSVLTLALSAFVRVVASRSKSALQVTVFLLASGGYVLLMGGVLEALWPGLPPTFLMAAKIGLGPLAGALSLYLLGNWLGVKRRDRMVRLVVSAGTVGLALAGLALLLAPFALPQADVALLFKLSGAADFTGVVLATLAATRAAMLGDRLSWFMVAACSLMAVAVAGLRTHSINREGLPLSTQIFTATFAMLFLMAVTWLVNLRAASHRRLREDLLPGDGRDPLTKLPQGMGLLELVDDALRRSVRLKRECAVIAVSIPNLYELNAEAGYDIDHDVAIALSARIRSIVGLHNMVGIYHPMCFVVAVPAVQFPRTLRALGLRLAAELRQPFDVAVSTGPALAFRADVGVGVVRIASEMSDASLTLEDAETLSGLARRFSSRAAIREVSEKQPTALELYEFARPRRKPRTKESAWPMTRF